ncbi:hypothetical protein J3E69DRAFT_309524 [Trichoderma sp. SZMC 28015]
MLWRNFLKEGLMVGVWKYSSRCPVHIIRLHAHATTTCGPGSRQILVHTGTGTGTDTTYLLGSTNTEYRRRRRQKQTATTRPGTSRQEAGRRSRTEVVRFPFAARLNELHRLRGCGWVWWRERGLGKGARGAWKDFCPNHTPCPGRRYLCLAGETRDGGGVGCRSGPGEYSDEYSVPALLSRSWDQELTAMRTLYKDKDKDEDEYTVLPIRVQMCGQGGLAACQCAI